MDVGQLCTRRPVTVSESAPLSEVVRLMAKERVGAVIVTNSSFGKPFLAGIVTDRDVVTAQLRRTADLARLRVGEAMTANVLTLLETDSLDAAVTDMRARHVRRAPVVTVDGVPVGLISFDDLLLQLSRELSGIAAIIAGQGRPEPEQSMGATQSEVTSLQDRHGAA